jgi:NAD-dependent DNA ligase
MFWKKQKPKEKIDLRNSLVVFTGKFDFGTRKQCVAALESRGGIHAGRTVYTSVKYVVVGNHGSPTWSLGEKGGQKIIQARENSKKTKGRMCRMITEAEFIEALLAI